MHPAQQGAPRSGFRTQKSGGPASEMDAFRHARQSANGFDMGPMRAEMEAVRGGMRAHGTPAQQSAWAQEMHMRGTAQGSGGAMHAPAASGWSDEFRGYARAPPMAPPSQRMGMGMRGMGYAGGMGLHAPMQPPVEAQSAPHGQLVQLDDAQWEEQFRQLDESTKGKNKAVEETAKEEAILREMQERLGGTFEDGNPRFDELWSSLKDASTLHQSEPDLAKWEEQLMEAIRQDDPTHSMHPGGGLGPGELGLQELDGLGAAEAELRHTLNEVDENGFPLLGEYDYVSQNPFAHHPTPFAEGLRLLEQNGSLTDAALLFEVATQRDAETGTADEIERTNVERSRAWQRLGESQAMNEREDKAIQALEQALRLDANNLEAHISLAVSYINEGYDQAAHHTLLRFLAKTHPHIATSSTFPALSDTKTNPWSRLNYVRELFLKAAREDAANGRMDADTQVALGVLFYSSSSYDQARDCFEAALKLRPDDFQLWNRLGATLANGGSPELATEAYHKALELRPTFTRAIYNLSVSCLNLGAHHQAAEYVLSALTLQRSQPLPDAPDGRSASVPPLAASEESQGLWNTLRSIFIMLNRMDLANQCEIGADMDVFRDAGFEF